MNSSVAIVSLLTTDSYVPGILALCHSLKLARSVHPFVVLVTDQVSADATRQLAQQDISILPVAHVPNPTRIPCDHRWRSSYSKLVVFSQVQFRKIIFLDADIIVLRNIDHLIDEPHLAAVSSGSLLPDKADLRHRGFNTGVMVIEPAMRIYAEMVDKLGTIEPLEIKHSRGRPINGSDQDFLNAFFPLWPEAQSLHLPHVYNMISYQLDEHSNLFDYTLNTGHSMSVAVLHFASASKPWNNPAAGSELQPLEREANQLWRSIYLETSK